MKRIIFLALSLFTSQLFAQTGEAVTYTLQQCVDIAIKNNLDVKRTEWLAQTNEAYVLQARAQQLPNLNGSISHGLNQGRNIDPFTNSYVTQEITFANYNLNANAVLWNGSSIKNNIAYNRLAFDASKMDVQQAKDNLTINVILAYLAVLNLQEQLKLSQQQSLVTQKQVERLGILNKDGAIAPSLLYDLRGQFANDELNAISIGNNLETAKLTLAQLMNVNYSSNMQLTSIDAAALPQQLSQSTDEIFAASQQQLAMIKAASLRLQSAKKNVESIKGERLPTLFINGNLGTNYSSAANTATLLSSSDVPTTDYVLIGTNKTPVYTTERKFSNERIAYGDQWKNNFNSSLSLGIRVPIMNGAQVKTRLNVANINVQRADFEDKTVKTQLRQAIDQAAINLNTANERLKKITGQVEDFAASFRAAEIRFNAGVGTSVDYLLAKNNLDRANGNLIAARYDYVLRNKILDFYRGQLSY
jgi:outer membrane protein